MAAILPTTSAPAPETDPTTQLTHPDIFSILPEKGGNDGKDGVFGSVTAFATFTGLFRTNR